MNHFLAYLSRMKYVRRWGLMRNTTQENVMEHSYMVSLIAHMLSEITNKRYNGNVNIEKVLLMALYHEAAEVLTGDLPTPVKYFDPEIRESYAKIENAATDALFNLLPEDLSNGFKDYFYPDKNSMEWKIVKAADKIAAYIKCAEEHRMGNTEFTTAKEDIYKEIEKSPLLCVKDFINEFADGFGMNLDQIKL